MPEKKFYDGELTDTDLVKGGQVLLNTSASPTANTSTICGIVQGTGESERIGRKCTLTRFNMRLNIEFLTKLSSTLGAASDAHETVRFMVYLDRQCNGTTASPTDILETDVYDSYRNLANVKRFHMIYDKITVFNTTAIGAGDGTTNDSERVVRDYQFNISKKLFIPIEFSSTTGVLTELASNNIGILVWSKHGTRMAVRESKYRFRFMDY